MTPRRLALPRRVHGFTLLEAIVALVVFTTGALALYGWLSSNLITLETIQRNQRQDRIVRSALDVVRRINPMETPEGRIQVGGVDVVWTARLLEPQKMGSSSAGSPTLFALGLYEVDVRASTVDAETEVFRVRKTGWKQVRTYEP